MKNKIKEELQKIYSVKKYCSNENMVLVHQVCSKYLEGLTDDKIDMLYMDAKTNADFAKFFEGISLSSLFVSTIFHSIGFTIMIFCLSLLFVFLNLHYNPKDYYLFNIIVIYSTNRLTA